MVPLMKEVHLPRLDILGQRWWTSEPCVSKLCNYHQPHIPPSYDSSDAALLVSGKVPITYTRALKIYHLCPIPRIEVDGAAGESATSTIILDIGAEVMPNFRVPVLQHHSNWWLMKVYIYMYVASTYYKPWNYHHQPHPTSTRTNTG